MRLQEERDTVVKYGRKLLSSRLTTGTGGNLSVCNRDKSLVAISPSGVDYDRLSPEDIVLLNMDGKKVEGELEPSSEWAIHLALYISRKDICAVVHTHSMYATTLACLHWEIPPVHYLIGFSGKKVPVAPYATFGTTELAKSVTDTMGEYNAVLMANHGLISIGKNMLSAFAVAEETEFVAQVYFNTKCIGIPKILSDKEMSTVIERFADYGQKEKPTPKTTEDL
jgi:L-fuculose-phosphate aldolase